MIHASRRGTFISAAVSVGVLTLSLPWANAASLNVVDCGGVPRLVRELEEGSRVDLLLKVAHDSGAWVAKDTLQVTDTIRGDARSVAVEQGSARVEDLSAGTWSVCPAQPTSKVVELSAVPVMTNGEVSRAALVGGGLGAGAIALALAVGTNDDGGSSDGTQAIVEAPPSTSDPVSSTGSGSRSPSAPSAKRPGNNVGVTADTDCGLDEPPPPPISPIG